jgi:ABC-2 type transport system permease protein
MNYLRLVVAFFRLGLMSEAAYRINFFIQFLQSILSLIVALSGIAVIFSYTDYLGGWGAQEILALLGVYIVVGGLIGLIIQPGMEQFIGSVRDGKLDYILIKPRDSQLLISIQRINIWSTIDILLGFAVLVTALVWLGERVGLGQAAEFVLMMITGAIIIYSFFLILATLSFWFVRVENILVIFQSMYEAGRWPISLYPGWLRYGLTFLIPVAFAVTIPAEALTGRLNWETLLGSAALSVLLFLGSRQFWRFGVKHYSGASA